MLQSGQTLEAAKNRSQSQALQDYYSGTFAKSPNGSGPGWPPGQQSTDGNSDTDTDVATIAGDIQPTPSTTGGQTTPPATNDAISQADTSVNTQAGNNASQEPGVIASIANWFKSLMQGLTSDLQDGSQYVTFKVDYGGPIGESFGNSFRPSEIEEQINSKVSAARVAEYNFADGKLVGGLLGNIVSGAVNAVKDAATGVLSGIHLSGLAAFAGAAYVDIPRMFDSSNTTMPSQSFTMHLRSPYGHKLALLQNLYIPLAAILAGVMPRATGPASYNAPFCCQLFAQGRMQVRYGMITSLSIQRGTGNIGFTKEGLPLGIDVTFEVTDFSSVMYMPIVAASGFLDHATMAVGQVTGTTIGAIAGAAGANTNGVEGGKKGEDIAAYFTSGMYSDDSIFSDYMAILGGLSLQDQIYPFRKWSIARDRQVLNYDMAKSPYHWALMLNGSIPGRIISGLVRGTDRP